MNLLEIFVTYLAVGSAFAMRGYFLNRRRPLWTRIRIVLTQFFLGLPLWLFKLTIRTTSLRRRASPAAGLDPETESQIENLISSFPGIRARTEVREALERYAALNAALDVEVGRASGQFELFAVSGNGNGATGTPCLYRKNLNKLKAHKIRTADSLISLLPKSAGINSIDSQLLSFFETFSDLDSVARLEILKDESNVGNSAPIRITA